LAYLALRRGSPVPRQTLLGLLWSSRGEEQARASLRQTLSALRKELGDAAEPLLLASNDSVALATDGVWVDALALEAASPSLSLEQLGSLAGLFAGDLLEGLALNESGFDQWLLAERESVRTRVLQLYELLATGLERAARVEDAITCSARALALDPLQEGMHRRLMGLYMQQGRHDAALALFEQCRRTLAEQLAAPPEKATLEVLAQVRQQRSQASARVATPTPTPSQPSTQPAVPANLMQETGGPALPERPSIAVLPFTNMSADPEQGFFSDGITEDIITELGKFRELFVIARNSSFAFKDAEADSREVGRKLGVRYLLEGSVRRLGQRIRVTAQLVDSIQGMQVWAERYDRELLDLFELQDELTRSIATTVKGRVDATVEARAACTPAASTRPPSRHWSGWRPCTTGTMPTWPHAMPNWASPRRLPNMRSACWSSSPTSRLPSSCWCTPTASPRSCKRMGPAFTAPACQARPPAQGSTRSPTLLPPTAFMYSTSAQRCASVKWALP